MDAAISTSVRVLCSERTALPSLAAQRRAGPGVKLEGGGEGMRGISLIDFESNFCSMFGSKGYRGGGRNIKLKSAKEKLGNKLCASSARV